MDLEESSLYLLPNRYFQSSLYAKYMQKCGWEVKEFWKKGQSFFLYFKAVPFFGLFAKIPVGATAAKEEKVGGAKNEIKIRVTRFEERKARLVPKEKGCLNPFIDIKSLLTI